MRFLLVPALVLAASAAAAQDQAAGCASVTAGDLTIERAWSRATIGAERPGALYLTIRNHGAADDALIGVSTPAAAMPMLHETVVEDGVVRMPHVASMPVPAGGTAALEPGGFHGMLMDLSAALETGGSFPVTLLFESGVEATLDVAVLPLPSQGPDC